MSPARSRPDAAVATARHGLLQGGFEQQARARPDAVAIVDGADRWTFGALEADANRLARLLVDAGCRLGDRVALLQPKGAQAVIGMLATLKAGGVYVPVDIAGPVPRVAKIVGAADPAALLVHPAASRLAEELAGVLAPVPWFVGTTDQGPAGEWPVAAYDRTDWEAADPRPLPTPARTPGDAAHLLFTSGSTGDPKGVVITHANVTSFVDWGVRYFGLDAGDRLSGHPPLHFDLSTYDIYATFAVGAQLHLVPAELGVSPHGLAAFIEERALTQWFSVPSAMSYLASFDAVPKGGFPALRRVMWCGEVLPTPVLRHWMARLPQVSFTNLYGPTEATIASSYYTVPGPLPDDRATVPIGTACDGEELLVLDEHLAPAPPGVVGDLYIAGAGLSPGYWRDADKTAAAFLPDPRDPGSGARIYRTGDLARLRPDGLVEFLGRADSQIKSRGYRIELGEVEVAANALDGVGRAAVVGLPSDGFEGTAIACAYTSDRTPLPPRAVRTALARELPSYMLPTRWLPVPELPANANGKIDRRRVKEMFADHD